MLTRSVLYLPASNARAIEKARGLNADAVILDLEDAVAPDAKAEARQAAVAALTTGGFASRVGVRINGLDTPGVPRIWPPCPVSRPISWSPPRSRARRPSARSPPACPPVPPCGSWSRPPFGPPARRHCRGRGASGRPDARHQRFRRADESRPRPRPRAAEAVAGRRRRRRARAWASGHRRRGQRHRRRRPPADRMPRAAPSASTARA